MLKALTAPPKSNWFEEQRTPEMPPPSIAEKNPPPRQIEYISPPAEVSMTDGYFELASLDHFWVARRFEVFQKLAGALVAAAREMAEVGCGQGLLQRQIEDAYGRKVIGFDLNVNGLKHNLSRSSRVCCYDVYQRDAAFRGAFDLVFLWDVIEHIRDEDEFVKAVMFHTAPGGRLVVNVPAGEWAFSGYDRAAGHYRRYSAESLKATAERNGLKILRWSYWGLPLVPTVAARKLWLMGKRDLAKAYSAGFGPRAKSVNEILRFVSKCEVIPQKIAGTSLMAILQAEEGKG
jgi:2-polyprenyl-3-methyl-5-hydroxy-6-metoxy-1,4-benzoquinol methylase